MTTATNPSKGVAAILGEMQRRGYIVDATGGGFGENAWDYACVAPDDQRMFTLVMKRSGAFSYATMWRIHPEDENTPRTRLGDYVTLGGLVSAMRRYVPVRGE